MRVLNNRSPSYRLVLRERGAPEAILHVDIGVQSNMTQRVRCPHSLTIVARVIEAFVSRIQPWARARGVLTEHLIHLNFFKNQIEEKKEIYKVQKIKIKNM